jgi:hypothetical protein
MPIASASKSGQISLLTFYTLSLSILTQSKVFFSFIIVSAKVLPPQNCVKRDRNNIRAFHTSQLEARFEPQLGPQLETKLEPEIRPISKLDVKSCLTPRSDIQLDPNLAPDFVPQLRLTHLGYARMPTWCQLKLISDWWAFTHQSPTWVPTSTPTWSSWGQVGVEIGAKLGLKSECVKRPIVFPASKLIILHVNMAPKWLGYATARIAMLREVRRHFLRPRVCLEQPYKTLSCKKLIARLRIDLDAKPPQKWHIQWQNTV